MFNLSGGKSGSSKKNKKKVSKKTGKKEKSVKKTKKYKMTVIIQKYTIEVLGAVRCDAKGKPLKDGGIIRCDADSRGMEYMKSYLEQGGCKIVKIVRLKKAPKN